MAAEDTIRSASDLLMKAVKEIKIEIDELRTEQANHKVLIATQIAQITEQVRMAQHKANEADAGKALVENQALVNQLKQALLDKQREIDEKAIENDRLIREKEDKLRQLESQAKALLS